MRVETIIKYLDNWAPKFIQWEKDNTGLLVGDDREEVTGVFLCLDVDEEAIQKAQKLRCNLILSHHPLIFFPIKRITPNSDRTSKLVTQLIKNNISLLSYHTNLDFTHDGVNHRLAKRIGVQPEGFLHPIVGKSLKLVVFVPAGSLDKVSEAIFSAGGGVIGNYSRCSYRSEGKGTFLGSAETNPAVGSKGNFEQVDEIRLEVLVNEQNLHTVIRKMREAHPYEEPAFDIYPVKNSETNYGMGVTGTLSEELSEADFLRSVAETLGTGFLRHSAFTGKKIRKVALFGGSASEYLSDAIAAGCDAFVTADIRYHTFQEAEGKILLIDAGHFETEVPVLDEIKLRLLHFFESLGESSNIHIHDGNPNPVKYFSL
ncbi:MAG: Nif3-like dinuclear metal center hexameric protein [Ignavibacteriales bacterium UTCHB3]|nr:MAG: Nif3-like dinuclear metal center hexameric protein [Ignavibacteriales bacterium UTCHB3]